MYFIEAFLILRESEDDETPQRAFFASEEAHREPAESVVYFRSAKRQQPPLILLRSLYQPRGLKAINFTKSAFHEDINTVRSICFIS